MFATKTDLYAKEPNLLGRPGARDRFDTSSPLYRQIAQLAALRQAHPALADGAQITRLAQKGPGVFAFSRVGADKREYVVAVNNATTAKTVTVPTYNSGERYAAVYGMRGATTSDAQGRVRVTVPAMSVVVGRADHPIRPARTAPAVTLDGRYTTTKDGRMRVGANVSPGRFVEATFYARRAGRTTWTLLGTDDNAPYQVFHDVSDIRAGTRMEYRVVVRDESGRVRTASRVAAVK